MTAGDGKFDAAICKTGPGLAATGPDGKSLLRF